MIAVGYNTSCRPFHEEPPSSAAHTQESIATAHLHFKKKKESVMNLYETGDGNETYDTQPACYLTDYVLALVAGGCALYVVLARSTHHHETRTLRRWYLAYFVFLALSSLLGGILHHCAHQALQQFGQVQDQDHLIQPPVDGDGQQQMATVFGVELTRTTLDARLLLLWRIVLVTSIATNFTLFALASVHYLDKNLQLVQAMIVVAAIVFAVVAIVLHKTFIVAASLVPVLAFGFGTSLIAVVSKDFGAVVQRRARNELAVYGFTVACALVQALKLAPSSASFNHNALAHVLLTLAGLFLLVNYNLEEACHQEEEQARQPLPMKKPCRGSSALIGDESVV